MRDDIGSKKKFILKWIKSNQSKAFIMKKLECKSYNKLDRWLKILNIEYGGNQGAKGIKGTSAKYYLKKNGPCVKPLMLKIKLIKEGLKKQKCEMCKLEKWLGQLIPTELHHVDGDKTNNELKNLQILCLNCHSLTPNWRGRKCAESGTRTHTP